MKLFALGLIAGLLLGAVVFYTRTVHAQTGQTVYVEEVRSPFKGTPQQTKGSQVVGVSCVGSGPVNATLCFVASVQ